MITIHPDYQHLFKNFKTMADFLNIEIDIVRDFKNRKTGRFEIQGQGFYIKKHFPCGLNAVLDELFHLRKPHIGAGYEKHALEHIESIGINTMLPVAFGQNGSSLAGQRSFLVTKELLNVESLEPICADWPNNPPTPDTRRRLTNEIARIARTLHTSGMNHRDFYLCHFLLDTSTVKEMTDIQDPKLYLIDLHRAQHRQHVPFRWLVKDIGGLYFSAFDIGLTRRDVYRFIRQYTQTKLRNTFKKDMRFWLAVHRRAVKTYKRDFGKKPDLFNSKQWGGSK